MLEDNDYKNKMDNQRFLGDSQIDFTKQEEKRLPESLLLEN